VFLPARSGERRRGAIAGEGAAITVVDGDYEEAVAQARAAATEPGRLEIADIGASDPAHWVIDGYQTLFAEAAAQGSHDLILVPVGVGSLGAAAARFAAATARAGTSAATGAQARVIGVEPATAACLTASLAGDPACETLRRAVALHSSSRVLLIATEGLTA
jgi:diaminopropionate ammonia-lyase